MKRGKMKEIPWERIGSVITNSGNYLIPEKVIDQFNIFLNNPDKNVFVSEIIEDDDSFIKYILTLTWGNDGHNQFTFLIEDRFDKTKNRKSPSIGDIYRQN